MSLIEREYSDLGECLGRGFDSFTQNFRSTAIREVDEEQLKKEAEKFSSGDGYSFEHIEKKEMLSKSFNASLSISGLGRFVSAPLILTGDAKGEFFSSKSIKSTNLYILLKYQLRNSGYSIKNPELSDAAKNFLNDFGAAEFRNKFGDEFIIGFRTGAEYTALIEILEYEGDSKQQGYGKIKSSISSVLAQGNIDGNMKNEAMESLKKINASVLCYKKGPRVNKSGIILTLDQLIDDFRSFDNSIEEHGCVKYTSFFADYDQLPDIKKTRIVTPELRDLKSKLNLLRNRSIEAETKLLKNRNLYRFKSDNSENNNDLENKIRRQRIAIDKIQSYMKECLELPEFIDSRTYNEYLAEDLEKLE